MEDKNLVEAEVQKDVLVEAPKEETPKTTASKSTTPKATEKPEVKEDYHALMVEELKALPFNKADTIEVVIKVSKGALGVEEHIVPMTTKFVKTTKA